MLETGLKIDNMVTVLKLGKTQQSMRVIMSSVKNTALELLGGLMVQYTLENSSITIFMDVEYILGLTIVSMKVSGEAIKCTEKEHSLGLMAESMSASTLRTKRKAMESSSGQTVGHTEESGSMESSMEKEPMWHPQAKRNTVNGKTEKE